MVNDARTSIGVFNNQRGKVDNNDKLCKIIIKLITSWNNIVIFDATFIIICIRNQIIEILINITRFLFNLLEYTIC